MTCDKSCGLDTCSIISMKEILHNIHYPEIKENPPFEQVDTDLRITASGCKWLSIIARTISNTFMEMRYCRLKFYPETYNIIRLKYSLWSLWYHQLINYISILAYRNCSLYPEPILETAREVEEKYSEELRNHNHELANLFLKTHFKVFQVFVKRLRYILDLNLPYEETTDNIGMLLSGGLAYSICEVTSLDSFLQNDPHVFILPEVFYLNKEINIFNLVLSEFPETKFKIYYINPSPESRTIVKWYLEQERLTKLAITY